MMHYIVGFGLGCLFCAIVVAIAWWDFVRSVMR